MSDNRQQKLNNFMRYGIVLLVAALIVMGTALFTEPKNKPSDQTTPATQTSETEGPTMTEMTTTTEEDSTEGSSSWLETEPGAPTVSAIDGVNIDMLIDRFYAAKINDDADELNKIVEAETTYNVADLKDETQFIEKYDNFRTYVIPGLTENYFIVYVKYDIFFNGIQTGAPALNHFIIAKNTDGYYYICDPYNDRLVSEELWSYLEETEGSTTVVKLRQQVERELQEACDKNEDLKYLIALLNGEDMVHPDNGPMVGVENPDANTAETEAPAEG